MSADRGEVVEYVREWKGDKFSEREIVSAFRHLEKEDWLAPRYDAAASRNFAATSFEPLPV